MGSCWNVDPIARVGARPPSTGQRIENTVTGSVT
jgi:hypothetical protein